MPTRTVNGCTYHYREEGSGDETIVFGHGYLMTNRMWDAQVEALSGTARCIRFDWRGQGETEITADGYRVPDLARDVAALVEALDAAPCHYVGLSMGGFVGFHLLTDHADLLRSAALLDTSAQAEPVGSRIKYEAMLQTVKSIGYDPVISRVIPILFGPHYRAEHPEEIERWIDTITRQDRTGIVRAGRGIFRRDNHLPHLGTARTPTLLLTGADDVATPPERARKAHDALPNSRLVFLPNSGHSSAVERPAAVTDHLLSFWESLAPSAAPTA
jgi:pimeloyl-ACP methyl ester carboxylesterase